MTFLINYESRKYKDKIVYLFGRNVYGGYSCMKTSSIYNFYSKS